MMPEKGGGQCKGDRSECGQFEKEGRSIGQQSATQIYMFLMYICVGFGNGGCNNNHADNKWPRMFVCVSSNTCKQMHRAGLNHLLTFSFFQKDHQIH